MAVSFGPEPERDEKVLARRYRYNGSDNQYKRFGTRERQRHKRRLLENAILRSAYPGIAIANIHGRVNGVCG